MLVMNPGFFMAMNELDILTSAFSARRMSKYVTYNGWMNVDIQQWLRTIDPYNDVCADIRKEMGWK